MNYRGYVTHKSRFEPWRPHTHTFLNTPFSRASFQGDDLISASRRKMERGLPSPQTDFPRKLDFAFPILACRGAIQLRFFAALHSRCFLWGTPQKNTTSGYVDLPTDVSEGDVRWTGETKGLLYICQQSIQYTCKYSHS